jgi:hypothetical protein
MASNVGVIMAPTFNTIIFDVSGAPVHGPLADTTQLIASLSTKLLPLNTGLFPPTFLLFNSHWYEGEFPALVAVAVKVTWEPVQIFVAEEVIVTVGTRVGLITTVVLPVSEVQPLASVAIAIQVPA